MDASVLVTLKQDPQEGRINIERFLEVIASQQRILQTMLPRLTTAAQRCAELKQKLGGIAAPTEISGVLGRSET